MQYNRTSILIILFNREKQLKLIYKKRSHLLACFLLPAVKKNNSSYIIYKKMCYLLKNSHAVKKGAALCKMVSMKKVVKYRQWPRNTYVAVMVDQ